MSLRTTLRFLLIAGIVGVLVGVYLRREGYAESEMARVGVIALLAAGLFIILIGGLGLLLEQDTGGGRRLERRRILDRAAWKATIPPLVGGGLMAGFFGLTDRWTNLGNPIASQLGLVMGVIGLLVGILLDRITRWELVLVPVALLVALIVFAGSVPESESTPRSAMIAMLVFALLVVTIAINLPQILRGRRRASE